jgi:hypothetical protein
MSHRFMQARQKARLGPSPEGPLALCGHDLTPASVDVTASADARTVRRVEWSREASSVLLPAHGARVVGGHEAQPRWSVRDAVRAVYAAPVLRRWIWNLRPSARCRAARAGVMGDHVVSGEAADRQLAIHGMPTSQVYARSM